jgi:TMEM175 potassium channel family protein
MRLFRGRAELSTGRVEAFSDGVFAIAITLLVLEIAVPHLAEGDSLFAALASQWPSFFGYVFSFFVIGIYWANHHYVFHLYRRSDHVFAMLNVLFLMTIAFLPFATAVLAEYVADPAHRHQAIIFYTLALALPAATWSSVWFYASRVARLTDARLAPSFVRFLSWQYGASVASYSAIVVVALINGVVGLVLAVGVSLLYLLPPRAPEYIAE